jgi:Flp pilus assembly protein TadD
MVFVTILCVLDSSYGLDQGFTYYDDEFPDPTLQSMMTLTSDEGNRVRLKKINERSAAPVTDNALAWLRNNADERFFLWIHYYDPHLPYKPPEPFYTTYLENPYDGEISFVDDKLGSVIDELKNRDLLDETLIVIVGDHGEALGEHEEQTHGIFIYESSVRVPLIFHYPEIIPASRRVDNVVSLVDVVPTIIDLLDVESDADFNGISLVRMMEEARADERFVFSESMFPYLNYGWSKVFGLRNSRWKYIKAPIPELYDVSSDPKELNNLFHTERETATRLEKLLEGMISETTSDEMNLAETARLSNEDRERLLALGYISGAPPAPDAVSLKDPKEMIQYHVFITSGEKAMQEGRFEQALEAFREVIQADPSNAFVRNLMGTVYYQQRDTLHARMEFQKAIEINPDIAVAYQNLGNIQYHQKNFLQAAKFYEKAIELDPNEAEYYIGLAGIYEILGDTRKAEVTYDTAIELGYSSPQLLVAHGKILMRLERFEDAQDSFEEALRINSDHAPAYNELGNLLDRMGNASEAASKYIKALSINPQFTAAHFNLARIFIKTGEKDEAIRELKTTIQNNPFHSGAHFLMGEI